MIDVTRYLAFLIWGVGVVVLFSIVLWRRRRAFARYRDNRARRDLAGAVALWIAAVAAFAAITLVLFGPVGTGVRGFAVAIALGAFFAVGLIMATEKQGAET